RSAQIEYGAHCGWLRRRQEERLDRVIDVREVARLFAAPYFDRLAFEQSANPHADERLPRILHAHARADRVGETQRRRRDAVHARVEKMKRLTGDFVDAIHVDRPQRMLFVDWEVVGSPVDLARARE